MKLALNTAFYVIAFILQTANATEELTKATFSTTINSGKNGMVKFFQTWCGHCTRMKPDWDKLSSSAHSSVFIADVNCGDEQELCEEHGVTGYPTIKYFIDGKEHDYNDARSYEALNGFINDKLMKKCDINDAEATCTEKEQTYIKKWKGKDDVEAIAKEKLRLKGMQDSTMTSDLKAWLNDRVNILNQLLPDENSVLQIFYDRVMENYDWFKPWLMDKSQLLISYFRKEEL